MVILLAGAAYLNSSARQPDRPVPPASRSTPVTTPTATSPPATGPASRTVFGASFGRLRGEPYDQALARTDRTLGKLDIVRVFYSEAPDMWPGKAPGRNLVVSFKLPPKAVAAGQYDAQMRNWFASAPRNLDIYWVFWHEPENDIEDGLFTAAEFRAAFARLSELARAARNPRLKATLVLMSYTTRESSERNWRDYYPGSRAVDIFGWDVYNRPDRETAYTPPQELLGIQLDIAKSLGKPFGIAEIGSVIAPGDDGSGRAAWLSQVGQYLKQQQAVFVAYFDHAWNGGADDYRLDDPAALRAWAEIRARP